VPIFETDLLYAYLHEGDKHHEVALTFFEKIRAGKVKPTPEISALSLIELEILLKSGVVKIRGKAPTDKDIAGYLNDVCQGLRIYAVPVHPLTCENIMLSALTRVKYGLNYYDSHYAAQAQLYDRQIISTDRTFDKVAEIKRIDPYTYVGSKSGHG
jgi:predicted nucleic acid-binding protein